MDPRAAAKLRTALSPRRRIYREPFNEMIIFLVSATGAAVLVPVALLVAGAIAGGFGVGVFLAASVVLELGLIFGVGRPQMRPWERLGWGLLWTSAALVFGVCFFYLVFENVV